MSGTILHIGASQTIDSVVLHQLRGLRDRGWKLVVACPDDAWARRIKADEFALAPIPIGRRPSHGTLVRGAVTVFEVVRRVRPALVHTHNAHHGFVGRPIARAHGIPSVHTWRYNPLDASDRRIVSAAYGFAEALASRAGNAVLFQNGEDLREATHRRLVPADRAHLIGNGIRVEEYMVSPRDRQSTRAALGLPSDSRVVVCVARLEERKRQADVIRAFAAARDSDSDLQLLLVGTGPEEAALRRLAADVGGLEHVHFAGQRDDVPAILHASDALVLASRREGVPRSVLEAMAAGIPVIATDVVGTREVARDGETALVVPLGAVGGLCEALLRALSDSALSERLTSRARRLVQEGWREEQVVDRVDAIYRSVIDETARRRLRRR